MNDMLTQAEMDTHIRNGTFRLAFVGMSNCGKSYKAKVLVRENDFYWHHVDGEIQTKLGFEDMDDISDWLGYPNNPAYAKNQSTYLESENACTKVDTLDTHNKNLVFDTTGSVINLPTNTLAWLKEHCLIIHLMIQPSDLDMMLERFIKEPKPVIWGDHFKPQEGESDMEIISRCYPNLLEDRLQKYTQLAHINIPAKDLYDNSGDEILDIIKNNLPQHARTTTISAGTKDSPDCT
jgi:shikimate kinase